ncbi:hypothetical protein [Agrococcus terreus]|uniref:D-inositol 3-phosphate glycosyltransferase n=1 Tax=Agrococcus terreus TaxID=574649 RepID=A0ABQ2KP45_9MICO|nr:hypothetical protein [Agrococcus terreus]GGN88180.1 hypothetical protein GCM10010968_23490 [Agrococcus terreus]
MSAPPLLVHLGQPEHGVDRCARAIGAAAAALDGRATLVEASADALGAARLHLHFTDRLWGPDPDAAAAAVERFARRARVSVTLHDLPQPSDGAASMARRAAAYRRVVEAAEVVVCSSEHERRLLDALLPSSRVVDVIPLPAAAPDLTPAPEPLRELAVLGFFYPGKGHAEAVEAAAAFHPPLAVTAIGRPSPGHEAELEALRAHAASRGVALAATGFLDDAALLERARRAAVPLVAHRHVSASGSLNDWLAAGRRAVVVENDYFAEMAALRPGTMTLVPVEGLRGAVEAALEDPGSTWLGPDARTEPHLAQTAAAYLERWSRW